MIVALGENPEKATAKRYLYALRSLLAGRHVLHHRASAPVEFSELLATADLSGQLRDNIDAMITAKSTGKESDAIGSQASIDDYLKNEHQRLSKTLNQMPEKSEPDDGAIDQAFRKLIEA